MVLTPLIDPQNAAGGPWLEQLRLECEELEKSENVEIYVVGMRFVGFCLLV
jgi:hypothetical protein